MTRLARVVSPGLPHHVTQRGNRRQLTFFREDDYELYLEIMAERCSHHGVEVWAYCLMPNHVHLIAVPSNEDGLRRAIGEAHRRYTLRINLREGWTGHLWQGCFASFLMDEPYLLTAARYVELNPVRAELVAKPWEYRWSSARAHIAGRGDILVRTPRLLEMVPDWRTFLEDGLSPEKARLFEEHERTGRPLGGEDFVSELEARTGRRLRMARPGRPPKGPPQPA